MNTPQANFTEQINGAIIGDYQKGIYCVEGRTQFGPLNSPDILITSPQAYEKHYGGEIANELFPTLCKRALNNGCALRIAGIKNGGVLADDNNTLLFTLSAQLATGQSIKFDPFNGNSYTVSQDFLQTSINTLTALVNKIKATYPKEYVKDAKVLSSTTITITPGSLSHTNYTVHSTGSGGPTVTKTNLVLGADSAGNLLFTFAPKFVGDYNDLVVEIKAPSNGKDNYFNIETYIYNLKNSTFEQYKNIVITQLAIAANQHFLDEIGSKSLLITPVYEDLSALTAIPTPVQNTFSYAGGSIGNALLDNDYIGDKPSKTGMYSFDKINGASILSILTTPSPVVGNAMDAYVKSRGDMIQIIHLDNSLSDVNQLVAARQAYSIDDSYTAFWAGGLVVNDTLSTVKNATKEIPETGDVLAAAAYNDINFGPWYSFSGQNRGKVNSALDVVNDFGTDIPTLNFLAGNQINIVKKSGSLIHLWHSFTGQTEENALSFINIRRMLIDLEQSLKPIVEKYIEEPNDIITWKALFLKVDPFLLERETKRAFYYSKIPGLGWFGDQFANSLNNLSVNDIDDVRAGKYKVNLQIIEIASMQQIGININLSPSGVSITDNFNNI